MQGRRAIWKHVGAPLQDHLQLEAPGYLGALGFSALRAQVVGGHRQHIKASLAALQIPGQLMLNYDQVWRIRYRGPSACLYKSEVPAGQEKSEVDRKPKRRAVVKRVMRKLGAEPLPEPKTKRARKERVVYRKGFMRRVVAPAVV